MRVLGEEGEIAVRRKNRLYAASAGTSKRGGAGAGGGHAPPPCEYAYLSDASQHQSDASRPCSPTTTSSPGSPGRASRPAGSTGVSMSRHQSDTSLGGACVAERACSVLPEPTYAEHAISFAGESQGIYSRLSTASSPRDAGGQNLYNRLHAVLRDGDGDGGGETSCYQYNRLSRPGAGDAAMAAGEHAQHTQHMQHGGHGGQGANVYSTLSASNRASLAPGAGAGVRAVEGPGVPAGHYELEDDGDVLCDGGCDGDDDNDGDDDCDDDCDYDNAEFSGARTYAGARVHTAWGGAADGALAKDKDEDDGGFYAVGLPSMSPVHTSRARSDRSGGSSGGFGKVGFGGGGGGAPKRLSTGQQSHTYEAFELPQGRCKSSPPPPSLATPTPTPTAPRSRSMPAISAASPSATATATAAATADAHGRGSCSSPGVSPSPPPPCSSRPGKRGKGGKGKNPKKERKEKPAKVPNDRRRGRLSFSVASINPFSSSKARRNTADGGVSPSPSPSPSSSSSSSPLSPRQGTADPTPTTKLKPAAALPCKADTPVAQRQRGVGSSGEADAPAGRRHGWAAAGRQGGGQHTQPRHDAGTSTVTDTAAAASVGAGVGQRRKQPSIALVDGVLPGWYHGSINREVAEVRLRAARQAACGAGAGAAGTSSRSGAPAQAQFGGAWLVREKQPGNCYIVSVWKRWSGRAAHHRVERSVREDGSRGSHFVINSTVRLVMCQSINQVVRVLQQCPMTSRRISPTGSNTPLLIDEPCLRMHNNAQAAGESGSGRGQSQSQSHGHDHGRSHGRGCGTRARAPPVDITPPRAPVRPKELDSLASPAKAQRRLTPSYTRPPAFNGDADVVG